MLKNFRYAAGERVKSGFYWNRRDWEAHLVPSEGGVLGGDAAASYLRVPLPVVLVLAPLMGLAYALFLPFIGFAMLAIYLTGQMKRQSAATPPAAGRGVVKRAA